MNLKGDTLKNSKEDIKLGSSIIISGPGKIKKVPVHPKEIKKDEVVVKMKCCSIYDEDISCWEGNGKFDYPFPEGVPGKDGMGTIVEAGELSGFNNGDIVAVLTDNCLSETVVCNYKEVVKLPASFKDKLMPIEAFSHALHIFRSANIMSGQTVLLLGKGFFSTVIRDLSIKAGSNVFILANKEQQDNGHYKYFKWHEVDKVKYQIDNSTNGEGCDCIIEFTGSDASVEIADLFLKKKGRLILTKVSENPIRQDQKDNTQLIWVANIDVINRIKNINDLLQDGFVQKKLNPEDFITHKMNFNDVEKAFQLICDNPKDYLKCMITFS